TAAVAQIDPSTRHTFLEQSLRIAEAAASDLKLLTERLAAVDAELRSYRQAAQQNEQRAAVPLAAASKPAGILNKVSSPGWGIGSRGSLLCSGLYRRLGLGDD